MTRKDELIEIVHDAEFQHLLSSKIDDVLNRRRDINPKEDDLVEYIVINSLKEYCREYEKEHLIEEWKRRLKRIYYLSATIISIVSILLPPNKILHIIIKLLLRI
jgi:hypothetical protein